MKANVIYTIDRDDLERAGWDGGDALPDIGLPAGCVVNAVSTHVRFDYDEVAVRVYDPSRPPVPECHALPFEIHFVVRPVVAGGTD